MIGVSFLFMFRLGLRLTLYLFLLPVSFSSRGLPYQATPISMDHPRGGERTAGALVCQLGPFTSDSISDRLLVAHRRRQNPQPRAIAANLSQKLFRGKRSALGQNQGNPAFNLILWQGETCVRVFEMLSVSHFMKHNNVSRQWGLSEFLVVSKQNIAQ